MHDDNPQWGRNGIYLGEDRNFFFINLGEDRNHFFQILLLFSIKIPKFRGGLILRSSSVPPSLINPSSQSSKILWKIMSSVCRGKAKINRVLMKNFEYISVATKIPDEEWKKFFFSLTQLYLQWLWNYFSNLRALCLISHFVYN